MAQRVDLDAVKKRMYAAASGTWLAIEESATDVPALVAELRAAREVVEEARVWSAPENAGLMPYAAQRDLAEKVAAYDQAGESA
jgi:hypothetical protein